MRFRAFQVDWDTHFFFENFREREAQNAHERSEQVASVLVRLIVSKFHEKITLLFFFHRFNGETKNFKLYFDGQHFVGEKRFDTVYDLVADGLIHFYIELKAADYIKQLSNESTYEESPYMAYNQCRLRHDKTLR